MNAACCLHAAKTINVTYCQCLHAPIFLRRLSAFVLWVKCRIYFLLTALLAAPAFVAWKIDGNRRFTTRGSFQPMTSFPYSRAKVAKAENL